jgi:hypothetical protein
MNKSLPNTGFVRLKLILELIPVSKSAWWAGVRCGRFPKPFLLIGPDLAPQDRPWRRSQRTTQSVFWNGNHVSSEHSSFIFSRMIVAYRSLDSWTARTAKIREKRPWLDPARQRSLGGLYGIPPRTLPHYRAISLVIPDRNTGR